jgi:hypothetical protein
VTAPIGASTGSATLRGVSVATRLATAIALGAIPGLALAEPPAPPPAPEREHRGFFLRFDGGLGYLSSSATPDGAGQSMGGLAIPVGISVGAAVVPNLIVAGEAWGSFTRSPSLVGLGVQLTWYFMPANVYLSVTPSIGILAVPIYGVVAAAHAGFAGKVAVGKEWWVGRKWGLGVAGQFHFGSNPVDGTPPPTWTTFEGGIALSVTFN